VRGEDPKRTDPKRRQESRERCRTNERCPATLLCPFSKNRNALLFTPPWEDARAFPSESLQRLHKT